MPTDISFDENNLRESGMLARLEKGQVGLAPLDVKLVERGARSEVGLGILRPDGIAEVSWQGRSYRFLVECKARSTPKVLQSAVAQMRQYLRRTPGMQGLVVVPYVALGHELVRWLQAEEVSVIDLCGNGLLAVPGELFVLRTGAPNLYPQSAPLKNPYANTASLAARVLLTRPSFPGVGAVRQEIVSRGGAISLGAVSKALSRLDDDLLIARGPGRRVRLVEPGALLDRLVANYASPRVRQRFVGRTRLTPAALGERLENAGARSDQRCVLTGACSAVRYAAVGRGPMLSVYCSDLGGLLSELADDVERTDRFPDVELLETDSPLVYFDRREADGLPWASPVQTYLELAAGDERDRQTAEAVRGDILDKLATAAPEAD